MGYAQPLFEQFTRFLEGAGIVVSTDVALNIQQVFQLNEIETVAQLKAIKYQLAPIVAKSPGEQQEFYTVFDRFMSESDGGTVVPEPPVTAEQKKIKRRTFLITTGAGVLLLLVMLFIWQKKFSQPEFPHTVTFSVSDSVVKEGAFVEFFNKVDTLHHYDRLTWNFGDGSAPQQKTKKDPVLYAWPKAGTYTVQLDAVSDSAHHTFSRTIKVLPDTACHLNPSFYSSDLSKPNLNKELVFINSTQSKCAQRYEWLFGDNTGVEKRDAPQTDSIIHRFTEEGTFDVRLRVFGNDTFADMHQQIEISSRPDYIPLAELKPLLQKNLHAEIKPGPQLRFFALLFCLLLVLIVVIYFLARHRVRKNVLDKKFANDFPALVEPTAPYTYSLSKDVRAVLPGKALNELAFRLRHPEASELMALNVSATIRETIRSAGFPKVVINESVRQPQYLVLLDLDSGASQQVALFEELLSLLNEYKVIIQLFWFRGSMETCFSDQNREGVSIGKLAEMYGVSRLIIYSNGYSLLQEKSSDGFVSWAPKIFRYWKNRALVTPVPRIAWSNNERLLNSLIPLYPAGLKGQLMMAAAFISGRPTLYSRESAKAGLATVYPDLAAYRRLFSAEKDRKIFAWLLALSIPEKTDWQTTLLIGRIVEAELCSSGEQLVNYENLLRLTSVEWLQTGALDEHHRSELFNALEKEAYGEKLIRAVRAGLLQQLEKIQPEADSTAAREKKIQETILQYQLSEGETKEQYAHALHYLAGKGMLNRFNKEQVEREVSSYRQLWADAKVFFKWLRSNVSFRSVFSKKYHADYLAMARKNAAVKLFTGIVGIGLLFVILLLCENSLHRGLRKYFPTTFTNDTLKVDSSVYFNNKAVNAQADSMIFQSLREAVRRDSKNDTAQYNLMTAWYTYGNRLYRAGAMYDALQRYYLRSNYPDYLYDPVPAGPDAVNDSSRQYKKATPLVRKVTEYLYHASGVCHFYIAAHGSVDPNMDHHLVATRIDTSLFLRGFYKSYPDKKNNLNLLLNGNLSTQYHLRVSAAPGFGKCMVYIINESGIMIPRSAPFDELLPQGKYSIQSQFSSGTGDTSIVLNKDMDIRVYPKPTTDAKKSSFTLTVVAVDTAGNSIPNATLNIYSTSFIARQYPGQLLGSGLSRLVLKLIQSTYLVEVTRSNAKESEYIKLGSDTLIKMSIKEKAVAVNDEATIIVTDPYGGDVSGASVSNTATGQSYGTTGLAGMLDIKINLDSVRSLPITIYKDKYQQSYTLNISPDQQIYELTLQNFNDYTVVFFPAGDKGERFDEKDASAYQQATIGVLRDFFPQKNFMAADSALGVYTGTGQLKPKGYENVKSYVTITMKIDQGDTVVEVLVRDDALAKKYPGLLARIFTASSSIDEYKAKLRTTLKYNTAKKG